MGQWNELTRQMMMMTVLCLKCALTQSMARGSQDQGTQCGCLLYLAQQRKGAHSQGESSCRHIHVDEMVP